MDSSDLRKLVRLQAKQIAELEEQIEEYEAEREDEETETTSDLERRLDTAEKNLEYERNRYRELDKTSKEVSRELAEERKKTRHSERLAAQVRQLDSCLSSCKAKLVAATEAKLTFEQKCEIRRNKIGDFLAESWQKHERSQVRWMMVAQDMCALLGVQFKEFE